MKVSIIVGGRFHAFDLAYQLQERNVLYELITSYPKSKAVKFNIDAKRIKTISFIEYFKRGFHKLFGIYPLNFFLTTLFDRFASILMKKDADVYILWAGMALQSIKKIRKVNPSAKIILERGSAHIVEQQELLRKVTGKRIIDKRTIQKELKEYDLVDFISLPGKFTKESFLKYGIPEHKLFINPYGVDLSLFRPTTKQTVVDELIVGFAGTLSAQKNITGIIEVIDQLVQENYNIKFQPIGNIDHKTFSKTELNKAFISYKKAIPQSELPDYYRKIDLFVLNSIHDGFGMVVLQALSCGVPVIATQNTGAADVIKDGETGYIIPAFDKDSLKKVIVDYSCLSSGQKEQMRINALKSVENGYSWQDYGNRYHQFIKTLN